MVLAAFFISSALVILALGAIQAGRAAAHERERAAVEAEVRSFLVDAKVPDPEHASGTWHGMPVRITIGHFAIELEVQLTPAVIPYQTLLAKFGHDLAQRLTSVGITVDAKDVARATLPRETQLAENLVSLENRLPIIDEVRALRRHAPGELIERIERARSSLEVDAVLIDLARHFPDAPETELAIEKAAEREHGHPDRVRERAMRWLNREPELA